MLGKDVSTLNVYLYTTNHFEKNLFLYFKADINLLISSVIRILKKIVLFNWSEIDSSQICQLVLFPNRSVWICSGYQG